MDPHHDTAVVQWAGGLLLKDSQNYTIISLQTQKSQWCADYLFYSNVSTRREAGRKKRKQKRIRRSAHTPYLPRISEELKAGRILQTKLKRAAVFVFFCPRKGLRKRRQLN